MSSTSGLVPVKKVNGDPPTDIHLVDGRVIKPDAQGRFWVTLTDAGALRTAGFEIDHSEAC